jgi:Zn-dependent protease with chaperone function
VPYCQRLILCAFACATVLMVAGKPALAQSESAPATGGFSAPTSISEIYSQVDLFVKLALMRARIKDAFEPEYQECAGPTPFEQRVMRLGERLAGAAYTLYPQLKARIPRFVFTVSDRLEPGIASTALGLVVVLTPVSEISLTDDALAFAIAREMGHVISRHHEQNTATSIAFSLLTMALAPMLNIGRLFALASSSASNSLAVNSVTSATSYASSRAVIASYGGRQRKVADGVAVRLMPLAGFDMQAVKHGRLAMCTQEPPSRWQREFDESIDAIPAPAAAQSVAHAEVPQSTAASPATESPPAAQ